MDWTNWLNSGRLQPPESNPSDPRTPFESDFDRVLFSNPTRRLANKTQVFPFDTRDSVRTRLTHSHEAATLARSLALDVVHRLRSRIVYSPTYVNGHKENIDRDASALLAAATLAHDLGTPPFAHRGEVAIQDWFKENQHVFSDGGSLTKEQRNDFLQFDANAQTMRIALKLQPGIEINGFNLTIGTLAALMKYPVSGTDLSPYKKLGYFQSEKDEVELVRSKFPLPPTKRHPFTYLVETCDDIAYAVHDVEDSVRKGIFSIADLITHLESKLGLDRDAATARLLITLRGDRTCLESKANVTLTDLNDVLIHKFRCHAIKIMLGYAAEAFQKQSDELFNFSFSHAALMDASSGGALLKSLKGFAEECAYRHESVLATEVRGCTAISTIMNAGWEAIQGIHKSVEEWGDPKKGLRKAHPKHRFLHRRFSRNYWKLYEDKPEKGLYDRLHLLVDFVSGMTDAFALRLSKELIDLGMGSREK